MPKQSRTACVFCGKQNGITKQHILPDRIRKMIDLGGAGVHTQTTLDAFVAGKGVLAAVPRVKKVDRPLISRKLHCVCGVCNNGWINRAETAGFEIARPLIIGSSSVLDEESQKALALLATTMFIMVDLDDRRTSAISSEERRFVFENARQPPNWHIFVGRVDASDWYLRFVHHGVGIITSQHRSDVPYYNTQISTISIGKLIIHVVSSNLSFSIIDPDNYAKSILLTKLCSASLIRWNDLPVLNNAKADRVANAFQMDLTLHSLDRSVSSD